MKEKEFDPQSDTGTILAYLSDTLEESRRLRENLKAVRRDGAAPAAGDAPSPAEGAPVAAPGRRI